MPSAQSSSLPSTSLVHISHGVFTAFVGSPNPPDFSSNSLPPSSSLRDSELDPSFSLPHSKLNFRSDSSSNKLGPSDSPRTSISKSTAPLALSRSLPSTSTSRHVSPTPMPSTLTSPEYIVRQSALTSTEVSTSMSSNDGSVPDRVTPMSKPGYA